MIEIKNLTKTFNKSSLEVEALKNVNITINDGDIFGIIGMSGAGKSTLIRCINMLEKPNEGQIIIDGIDITKLQEKQLREIRRNVVMIFQSFNLLAQRTCLENVCFPMELVGIKKQNAKEKALELLELVGLKEKANVYPATLSGGQQQRVAIARALASNPKVLLCDEATSALDPTTTNQILDLIRDINKKLNITVIVITHQMSVVENVCNKVAILDNGSVVEEGFVGDVFSNPKSNAAKALVFPEGNEENLITSSKKDKYLRVVFNGAKATNKPIIATMASAKGIILNIINASTRSINDKVYGSMLLSVSSKEKQQEAVETLSQIKDVIVQEVDIND